METGYILLCTFGLVILSYLSWFLGKRFDERRMRSHVESFGGKFLSARRALFRRTWFGRRNAKIYELHYLDYDGNEHEATCEVILFMMVRLTDDQIVRFAGYK